VTLKQLLRPALLLAAAALTLGASPPQDWNRTVTRTAQQSNVLGNPAAKVKLTTWVSYTCPSCARFEQESDAGIKLKYIRSGKVSVEIRHFVRDPVDLTVAMLTNCGSKDKFPLNHSAFMRSQPVWIQTMARSSKAQQARWSTGDLPTRTRAIANDFRFFQIMATRGYDRVAVDRCLTDVAMAQRLAAGTEAASKFGVDHTPSFALDGALLFGTGGWDLLQPQIEARM
jgi:protein-disulfide isomerase